MQAVAASPSLSDPLVERHFDHASGLYVDHALECYRTSVTQRLNLLQQCLALPEDSVFSVLDIGCGGGAFLDMLLTRFPAASATGVDISRQMLAGNVPHERKTLLQEDALNLPTALGEFDAICIDTVMHHLIERSGYVRTIDRIRGFLRSLHALMQPSGVIVIREIYHEYRLQPEFGSRTIYELTTLNVPGMLAGAMRAAGLQTANVGVCFLTRRQWLELFRETGFAVAAIEDHPWPGQPYKRFGFAQSGDLHFVLTRMRPQI